MKRMLFIIVAIALIAALVIPGTLTHAAQQRVALSAGDSLSDALENVADGGTIEVSGTVAVTEALGVHGKSVTITGGTLDFTGFAGDICLGDHITFENIRLSFVEDASLFACGYEVEMGEGITMPNPIKIYGGKKNATVESTHLTLRSGTYSEIYGGGYNGNVIGDTNLYVGGNVNESVDVTSHDRLSVIYGGGYASWNNTVVIGGTANTVLTGSAKANYLYGGVITCGFTNASAVTLSPNGKKDLHVHSGGSAVIPGITE